jgi:hypothetical protein
MFGLYAALAEFCKIAIEFLRRGANPKLFVAAASMFYSNAKHQLQQEPLSLVVHHIDSQSTTTI